MISGAVRLFVFVLDTVIAILFALLASLADRDAKLAYKVARAWAWVNVKLCGSHVSVRGLEHLDRTRSYVFMSNHRSNFDVLALMVALWDFQLRWVAKEELFHIPLFGWGLRATKQILVNRADHAQAVASLERARDRIRGGISVVFFPEGTRSPGDEMLPFKKGGFVFAIETGTPIVPIGIKGTARILPRDGWTVYEGGDVEVVVTSPIPTDDLTLDDRDALLARVERTIAATVGATPAVRERARAAAPLVAGVRATASARSGTAR